MNLRAILMCGSMAVPLAAAETLSLSGRVVEWNGTRVTNLCINVNARTCRSGGRVVPGPDGVFAFTGLSNDVYDLWVYDTMFAVPLASRSSVQAGTSNLAIVLPRSSMVQVAVSLASGAPATGLAVSVIKNDEEYDFDDPPLTGPDGTFRVPVRSGAEYSLVVSSTGLAPVRAALDLRNGGLPPSAPVALRFKPFTQLKGTIVAAPTNAPVAGACVYAVAPDGLPAVALDEDEQPLVCETDEQGGFELDVAADGAVTLEVYETAECRNLLGSADIAYTPGSATGGLVVTVPVAFACTGMVTKAGAPVGLGMAFLVPLPKSGWSSVQTGRMLDVARRAPIGTNGIFVFQGSTAGRRLLVVCTGTEDTPVFLYRAVTAAPGSRLDAAFAGATLRGTVTTPAGAPIAEAEVVAVPAEFGVDALPLFALSGASTGTNGAFAIPFLAEGSYIVRAEQTDRGVVSTTNIVVKGPTTDVSFTFSGYPAAPTGSPK